AGCAPYVRRVDVPAAPDWTTLPSPPRVAAEDLARDVPGLRPDAPVVLVALRREQWGLRRGGAAPLVRAVAQAASRAPELDWAFISNLTAQVEGPLRALSRPDGFLPTPPLPYPVYRRLLERARLVVVDSAAAVADAAAIGRPWLAVVEEANAEGPPAGGGRFVAPDRLDADVLVQAAATARVTVGTASGIDA